MRKILKNNTELADLDWHLKDKQILAVDIEGTDIDIQKMQLQGIGLGDSEDQWYIPTPDKLDLDQVRPYINKIFKEKTIIFHNAKYDLQVFAKYNFDMPPKIQDTMIMAWLVDENRKHGLKALTKDILKRKVTKFDEVNQQPDLFRTEDDILKDLGEYCMDDIKNTFDLYEYFLPLLEQDKLMMDYEKIELPLIFVLSKMESKGVKLDMELLEVKKDEADRVLKVLIEELDKLAPGVSVRSSKQLQGHLFDTMELEPVKVTPGGSRSTDNETLETLVKKYKFEDNDFIPMLLRFRDLDKLKSTYLQGLLDRANKGTIHAHFLQHGTRTGRLSSNDPNLQNIPARHDEWDIRRAFIPRKGHKFILSDYSQIELRMLAHFSKDEKMVQTFNEGGDIHAKTMELTGLDRRPAKVINFGIIYGMGPQSLGRALDISMREAEKYINKFFAGYPTIKLFIKQVQRHAINQGYVTMITGRKRRFYGYKEDKWFGTIARQSVNTKIQGSAADLIKIAMIKLDKALAPYNSYQLIQIHDEVIVEVPEDKVEEVSNVVTNTMEAAAKLQVPLKADTKVGDYWIKD